MSAQEGCQSLFGACGKSAWSGIRERLLREGGVQVMAQLRLPEVPVRHVPVLPQAGVHGPGEEDVLAAEVGVSLIHLEHWPEDALPGYSNGILHSTDPSSMATVDIVPAVSTKYKELFSIIYDSTAKPSGIQYTSPLSLITTYC